MADQSPDNSDIETIFNRLRLIPANKVCFDCCAKNPTWSSVTYGVFICIDCSAVHRSLGVHLTFVRSTQLDTNWTWLQIRQMQLGGNANADQFFRQHNCMTSDTQQKYTSRAASLYRDKLQNAAQQAIRLHGTQLFLDTHVEHSPEKKDVDFFEELSDNNKAASFGAIGDSIPSSTAHNLTKGNHDTSASKPGPEVGPKIDGSCLMATERKPTIGVRKIQPRRSELGARKGGGLGATKVKTNFADIEREANLADKLKEQSIEDLKIYADSKAEDEEKTMASMRLAYKDLSVQQSKEEERLKISDPKKALQMERLGMGFASARSGVSHSALSDMHTIEQDNLAKKQSNFSQNPVDSERDVFFDDYNFTSMNMYTPQGGESKMESFMDGRGYGNSEIIEPESRQPIRTMFSQDDKPKPKPSPARTPVDEDAAQKKFGNAKNISSDQYFNEGASQFERNANLSRFQGSSSISSADYFGDGSGLANKNNSYSAYQGAHFNAPDMEDVKESVRQGVTKVAGKLSSLATGVMSSLQDKYGY